MCDGVQKSLVVLSNFVDGAQKSLVAFSCLLDFVQNCMEVVERWLGGGKKFGVGGFI
jgi:hypothetical protein